MDVKKLITGFLILAAAAGSSALIISTISAPSSASSNAAVAQTAVQIVAAGSAATGTLGGNAFLPPTVAVNTSDYTTSSTPDASDTVDDPDNLTDSLADSFLNGVISANPTGPVADTSGNEDLTPPDPNAIASQVVLSGVTENVQAPDWNVEADEQPIHIMATSSPQDAADYTNAINNIFTTYFADTNVDAMLQNESDDPESVAYIEGQFSGALGALIQVPTPSSLASFQRGMVTMLVYEKNEAALVQSASGDDPVRVALIFQNEEGAYATAVQNLDSQMTSLSALNITTTTAPTISNSGSLGFLSNLFGVQKAFAIDAEVVNPVLIVYNPSEMAHDLQAYVQDTILQILKNTIVALIQKKVLTWIQGSGAPRFVQQWGTTLVNAYEQTALNTLNSAMTCVNPSFSPQIVSTLGAFYKPANNSVCANSFQAALGSNSVKQFYTNFANGSWLAFGASVLPTGNYYGSLYFTAQTVNNTAQNQQQAAQAKVTASQGWTGDDVCDDGSAPQGTHMACLTPKNITYSAGAGGACQPGDFSITEANNGVCSDGSEPQVSTPGQATGQVFGSGVDSNPKLITAATTIAGILNAMLSSLLNTLASTAINAAGKLVNNTLTSTNAATIGAMGGGGTGGGANPPAPLPLACFPTTQTVTGSATSSINIEATGGTVTAADSDPTYTWTSAAGTVTGPLFSSFFPNPGTYTVTLSDSTGDAPTTCSVTVQ